MPCCLAKIGKVPTIKTKYINKSKTFDILGFPDLKYAKGLDLEACVKLC